MKSLYHNKKQNLYFYSVIIPLYNKGLSILSSLDSVFFQTCDDYEIIIVNDGSTDDGPSKVQALQHPKVIFVEKENGGVSSARNVAANHANGRYLAFMDADDLWMPDYLSEMKKLINAYPDGGGYGADWIYRNELRQWAEQRPLPEGYLDYFTVSLSRVGLNVSATVMPRNTFFDLGGFDERLSRGEDLDLWFRLANNYKIYTTGKQLTVYVQNSVNRACLKPIINYEKCFSYHCPSYKTLTNEPYKSYVFKKAKEFSFLLFRKGDIKELFFYLKKHFQFGDFYKLLFDRSCHDPKKIFSI